MRKHKNIIIAVVAVAAVLAAAWLFGGRYPLPPAAQTGTMNLSTTAEATTAVATAATTVAAAEPPTTVPATAAPTTAAAPPAAAVPAATTTTAPTTTEAPTTTVMAQTRTSAAAPPPTAAAVTADIAATTPAPTTQPASAAPAGPPATTAGADACTLEVRCDTILNNMNMLDKSKWGLVPADGVIFAKTAVAFTPGDSVFDALQRGMKSAGIQMQFKDTAGNVYIDSIGNLYEFDAGELSGWMYSVNGVFQNIGCSLCKLRPGDAVEWQYTCDLGGDVGAPAGGW